MGNRRIPREIKEALSDSMKLTHSLWLLYSSTWGYLGQLSIECMLSGLRRVMLFDRSMDAEYDLVFCTFLILTISSVSFSTDLIGFSMRCFICFKQIASCPFTILVKIGFGVLQSRPEVRSCRGERSYRVTWECGVGWSCGVEWRSGVRWRSGVEVEIWS